MLSMHNVSARPLTSTHMAIRWPDFRDSNNWYSEACSSCGKAEVNTTGRLKVFTLRSLVGPGFQQVGRGAFGGNSDVDSPGVSGEDSSAVRF